MRRIQPAMIAYLDEKLKDNFDAKYSIKNKMPRMLMVEAARACVGIRELTNRNDGPLVELIQKTVDGRARREPYCMAGVQTLVAYAELKTGIKSKLFPTEHCMTLIRKTPADMFVKYNPLPGAIPIWNLKDTDDGHTGVVILSYDDYFKTVEFNTIKGEHEGKIIRDGGGVYELPRPRGNIGNMIFKGFIKPF